MRKPPYKYVVVLCDGMADYPDGKGRTPMTQAKKPNMDGLASISEVGLCRTVPEGMKPGSDVANLSVLGYDPRECYTGRSPLEAVSIGIPLGENDVTYRCNLVCVSDEADYGRKTMLDYSSGEITTDEARELIACLNASLPALAGDGLKLYAGVSYRHCLVRKNGKTGAELTPPHDISDRVVGGYLPRGAYSDELRAVTEASYAILSRHPVNRSRIEAGKKPANSVWFWGEGTKPKLDGFREKFGLSGAVISAVDLVKGIGIGAGMRSIDVEGATGTVDTNFEGKAAAAIEALKTCDYVYVHLEAPDECGHQGDRAGKILSIELIDKLILEPIALSMAMRDVPYKMLILPDHATPLCKKTHTSDPVPYLVYDSEKMLKGPKTFDEFSARETGNFVENGFDLLPKMLKG